MRALSLVLAGFLSGVALLVGVAVLLAYAFGVLAYAADNCANLQHFLGQPHPVIACLLPVG